MNWLTSLRGSYSELTTLRIPHLVAGLLVSIVEKLKVSVSVFHFTPSARSNVPPLGKQRQQPLSDLSAGGIAEITSSLLLTHFVSLKPPFSSSEPTCCTSCVASFTVANDLLH